MCTTQKQEMLKWTFVRGKRKERRFEVEVDSEASDGQVCLKPRALSEDSETPTMFHQSSKWGQSVQLTAISADDLLESC